MFFEKISNSAKLITTISSAVIAIVAALGWVLNEYQEHKETRDNQLDEKIRNIIEEDTKEIISNIDEKTEKFENVIDSLSKLIENESFYNTGWGSRGDNFWYYRTQDGKIHKCYYNDELGKWYYILEGKAIYL